MGEFINICAGADRNSLPESPVKALLFNVLDHCSSQNKINAAKEMYRVCRPKYSMLDSSGYQLLLAEPTAKILSFNSSLPLKFTGSKINLAPKHVMESAFNLQPYMPDIVIGLDFPVKKLKDVKSAEAEFCKKLEYNVRWTVQSAVWWKEFCPEAQFFIPIQCYDLDQFNVFHDKIGGLDCDGYSMPIRNLEIWEVALFLVKFYQLGIRRVHLLGTSKLFAIALCAYMARHHFDWVSLDASSWRKAADKAECFNPFDLSREKFGSRVIINDEFENDCPCPHCTDKTFVEIRSMALKDKLSLLRNHNWWVLENIFNDLYENSRDIIQLERFLKSRCKKPAEVDSFCNILSLVKLMKDTNINLLQDLLGFGSKKRKPSRTSRKQTVPA